MYVRFCTEANRFRLKLRQIPASGPKSGGRSPTPTRRFPFRRHGPNGPVVAQNARIRPERPRTWGLARRNRLDVTPKRSGASGFTDRTSLEGARPFRDGLISLSGPLLAVMLLAVTGPAGGQKHETPDGPGFDAGQRTEFSGSEVFPSARWAMGSSSRQDLFVNLPNDVFEVLTLGI